jgi:hypothetical protein
MGSVGPPVGTFGAAATLHGSNVKLSLLVYLSVRPLEKVLLGKMELLLLGPGYLVGANLVGLYGNLARIRSNH